MTEPNEVVVAETQFGTVTEKRLVFFRKKGWLSGGSREDIPLKHITSVRLEISRHIFWGIIFILIGIGTLKFVVGFFLIALAVLFLWGSPAIVINTPGNDKSQSQGWPW